MLLEIDIWMLSMLTATVVLVFQAPVSLQSKAIPVHMRTQCVCVSVNTAVCFHLHQDQCKQEFLPRVSNSDSFLHGHCSLSLPVCSFLPQQWEPWLSCRFLSLQILYIILKSFCPWEAYVVLAKWSQCKSPLEKKHLKLCLQSLHFLLAR